MKTLGILGGVGPQTTSEVYLEIINLIRNGGSKIYPPILIYNLPFPFVVEKEAIVDGVNSERMIPYLTNGAKILEKAGADFVVLPCNTLHKFSDDIISAIKIPFVSIVDETALFLEKNKIKNVGLLGTETTVRDKIYNSSLEKAGIDIIYPNKDEQNILNNIIIELIRNGKSDSYAVLLQNICESLRARGAESILLACTDLQLLVSNLKISIPVFDTTKILVESSVKNILG